MFKITLVLAFVAMTAVTAQFRGRGARQGFDGPGYGFGGQSGFGGRPSGFGQNGFGGRPGSFGQGGYGGQPRGFGGQGGFGPGGFGRPGGFGG